MSGEDFLDLLYADAPREAFDDLVARAQRAGLAEPELQRLQARHTLALRLHERIERQRHREAEMSALYDTASDLTAIRDVDAILSAIVRRARSLLHADMTYLSLNDEAEGASYMRVTDGALTAAFRRLRLPLGTGLLGLVAQTGEPYYTEDYQHDPRFVHREFIDTAVSGEQIRAILGVPLLVEGKVIGALLAVHRTVRPFPAREVTLLTSFAAHAAVALENARLFERLDQAHRQVRAQAEAVSVAADAHDRLTDVVLRGGGVPDVAGVLADVLHATVSVLDSSGHPLVGEARGRTDGLAAAVAEAEATGRSVETGPAESPVYLTLARAGTEHLGTLVVSDLPGPLDLAARRTLERGGLVTALVLLFSRSVLEAEARVRGELLTDLLEGRYVDEGLLRERARRQHAELEGAAVLAVAVVDDLERHRAVQVAGRLGSELHGLAGEHQGRVVLVAPGADPLEVGRRLAERLRSAGATCTVGVVGSGGGPGALTTAYPEANACLDALLTLGRAGEVSDPAGLGLARLVLGRNGPAELDAFVQSMLGPVLAYDASHGTELLATVEAWFAAGGRPSATAQRLHVHPNTVAQRLDRVRTLLGDGWRDPARTLDLQMALHLLRLRLS